MKDLLIRILVSAVIGSIVSAGVLWFAFDQSLRGVETAIDATNERIGDSSDRVGALESKIDGLSGQINGRIDTQTEAIRELATMIDKRLGELGTSISLQRSDNTAAYVDVMDKMRTIQLEVRMGIESASEIARIVSSLDTVEGSQREALLVRIGALEQSLVTLDRLSLPQSWSPEPAAAPQ